MDINILFVSLASSSLGEVLDTYSTMILRKDVGVEFESNSRVRRILFEGKPKEEILKETALILAMSFSDAFLSQFYGFSLGLSFGAGKIWETLLTSV